MMAAVTMREIGWHSAARHAFCKMGPAAPKERTARQRPASREQMSSLRMSALAAILALKLWRRRRYCSAAEHRFSRALHQSNRLRDPTSLPARPSCAAIDPQLHAPACPAAHNQKCTSREKSTGFFNVRTRRVCGMRQLRRWRVLGKLAGRLHYRKLVWRLRLFL